MNIPTSSLPGVQKFAPIQVVHDFGVDVGGTITDLYLFSSEADST